MNNSYNVSDLVTGCTCAFLSSPPVLPPKIGAGVEGSRLGGVKGFFSSFLSSFLSSFSFVAPSAETRTLNSSKGQALPSSASAVKKNGNQQFRQYEFVDS